jgi:hypothetical protein
MEMRVRILGWASWAGWRRFAPFAGSVLVNVAILAAIASLAAGGMEPIHRPAPISVTLLPDLPSPPSRPEPRASAPRPAPPVVRRETGRKAEPAAPAGLAPPASVSSAAPDGEVYVGPPLGLRSLLEKDPCNSVAERMRNECSLKWAKLMAEGEYVQAPTREELRRMYPGFGEEPSCGSSHMGCIKAGERWTSLNGTHEVTRRNGAGTSRLGSINEMIGRLGPANEYQRDPGFGD